MNRLAANLDLKMQCNLTDGSVNQAKTVLQEPIPANDTSNPLAEISSNEASQVEDYEQLWEESLCSLARERTRCTEGINCLFKQVLERNEPLKNHYQSRGEATVDLEEINLTSVRGWVSSIQELTTGLRKDIPELINQCKRFCESVDQNQNMLKSNTDQILFSVKRKPGRSRTRDVSKKIQKTLSKSLHYPDDGTPIRRRSQRLNRSSDSIENSVSNRRTRSANKSYHGKFK